MKYVYCIIVPLVLQIITAYSIIHFNTGNGSWIGLGVFLFAIPILPATTIINAVRTNKNPDMAVLTLFGQNMLIAFAAPIVLIALFIGLVMVEALI